MNYSFLVPALLVFGFLSAPPYARANDAPESSKLLTPEGSLHLRSISDLQLSPDGQRLAFVVTESPKEQHRQRHIWICDTASAAVRQFTYSEKSETSPRWSPDGKQLAFLSDREGDDDQIYLLRLDGGEAEPITKGKRSVRNFAWSPNGKQIAFLAPDAKTDEEEKKETDKNDAHLADKDEKHARVWLLTLATSETKAITQPNWEVQELAWLPNGNGLVVTATDHPESDQETNRIFGIQLSNNSMPLLFAPTGPFGELRLSPDGKTVSFIGARTDGPEPSDLMLLDLGSKAARNVTGASLDRSVFGYHWLKDRGLFAVVADGFKNKFVAFTPQGSLKDLPPITTTNVSQFALAESGNVYFVGQSSTQPQELWQWDQKTAPKQLSHLNDSWKQFTLSSPDFYKYKSFDGLEIEAALLKPLHYDGKSKLPLIALIHGGPTGKWDDEIDSWGQLLAARGYAVFYPNIRGSVGYGQKFVEMNRADWGGADFKDIMAGLDDLIAKGIADPDKLAIGGWSYGGFMAEWAITQTTRFKASVSGAGLSNLISEYGTEEHPSYDEWFYGLPYEKPEGFLNSSPFVYLKNVKTPTLILQGEADPIDPPGQSFELYRGLKHYGVETELVLYPRELHGFREEKHLLDRLNRILAWYDKHLNPEESQKDQAAPKGSGSD